MGGRERTGPTRQLLDVEAFRLDQSEEEQKERWRSGQKARRRQTGERGGQTKKRKKSPLLGGVFAVPLSQMD